MEASPATSPAAFLARPVVLSRSAILVLLSSPFGVPSSRGGLNGRGVREQVHLLHLRGAGEEDQLVAARLLERLQVRPHGVLVRRRARGDRAGDVAQPGVVVVEIA